MQFELITSPVSILQTFCCLCLCLIQWCVSFGIAALQPHNITACSRCWKLQSGFEHEMKTHESWKRSTFAKCSTIKQEWRYLFSETFVNSSPTVEMTLSSALCPESTRLSIVRERQTDRSALNSHFLKRELLLLFKDCCLIIFKDTKICVRHYLFSESAVATSANCLTSRLLVFCTSSSRLPFSP